MARSIADEVDALLAARPEAREAYEQLKPLRDLQNHLIKARVAAELTQQDMADRMGVPKSQISRMESIKNRSWPTLETIYRYAKAVGCHVELAVLPGDGPSPKAPRTTRSKTPAKTLV